VHAVAQTLQPRPGPVHLNFPFRDPLAPEPDGLAICGANQLEAAATVLTRLTESVQTVGGLDAVAVERLMSHERGLIVVGAENPPEGDEDFADGVALLAQKLGWPVLSDVLNPLRHHAGEMAGLVGAYDCFLRDPDLSAALRPTAVLQIGILPTSKVLRAWLQGAGASTFLLSRLAENTDPLHRVATPLYGDVGALAELLPRQKTRSDWSGQWQEAERQSWSRIDRELAQMESPFEGKVAWVLSQFAPVGASVFLANSMSVRYAESFWKPGNRAVSIYCNRGANGIDGTLSTAMGMAHGGHPAICVTGDLAFLHDSNGLLAAKQLRGGLAVIVIDNRGGGIFEYLPVAQQEAVFESHFATPQSVDLAQLCQAHGVPHRKIEDWAQLTEALADLPASGLEVLELQTDRKADVTTMRSLLEGGN